MIYSGPIPTFEVSPNSLINSAANSLVSNLGGTALQVALNPEIASQVFGSPNLLNSIVTPGLISTGNQAITQAIAGAIEDSGALGPFGPMVSGIAESIVNNLTGDFIQSLLPRAQSDATRYFPGAGQEEEDADYGGNSYTPGVAGPDVVFSIKPAQTTASSEAQSEVNGNGSGISSRQSIGEVSSVGGIPNTVSSMESANLFSQTWGSSAGDFAISGYSLPGGGVLPESWVPPSSLGNFTSSFTSNSTSYSTFGVLDSQGASLLSIPGTSSSGVLTINPSVTFPVYPSISAAQAFGAGRDSFGFSSIGGVLGGVSSGNNFSSSVFGSGAAGVGSTASAIGFDPGTTPFFNNASLSSEALENSNFSGVFGIGQVAGGSASQEEAAGWKFTTAPADISWESVAKVDRVQIFGSNQPPVTSGSRGMRDLTLSNALIEGFSMVKSVEGKVAKLEALLNYTLTKSYVKVPVYWVTANDKKYGDGNNDGGYFVIKSIKVKEEMRDLTGKSTRATVDVTFTQVPPYQVDDGRDQASQSIAGGKTILSSVSDTQEKLIKEGMAKGLVSVGDGTSGGVAGGTTTGGTSTRNSLTTGSAAATASASNRSSSNIGFVTLGGVRIPSYFIEDNTVKVPQLVTENGKKVIKYLPGTR